MVQTPELSAIDFKLNLTRLNVHLVLKILQILFNLDWTEATGIVPLPSFALFSSSTEGFFVLVSLPAESCSRWAACSASFSPLFFSPY